MRKRVSGLGFERGLHREIAGATGDPSKGSGWRGGGRRRAHGGGARLQGSGVESGTREGWEKREKLLARTLTTTRSFWSACSTAVSGEAVAHWAAEAWRQWQRRLGLRERRRRLRLGGELGQVGGHLNRAARAPRHVGPGLHVMRGSVGGPDRRDPPVS
jgi:hypothetical protein